MGENLHGPGLDNNFLDATPKTQSMLCRKKNGKLGFLGKESKREFMYVNV